MSFEETALLGAIAGFTIFLGLPVGRMRSIGARTRVALSMFSAGILAFIFMDVLARALGIIEGRSTPSRTATDASARVGLFLLLVAGFARSAGIATSAPDGPPSAPSAARRRRGRRGRRGDLAAHSAAAAETARRALRTGMTIAVGDRPPQLRRGPGDRGLGTGRRGGLATVLIIGFALHNATEGFGIVGPLGSVRRHGAGCPRRPRRRRPTFLGAMVGYQVTSDALELLFFALAGGAILYVIGEIWAGVRRWPRRARALHARRRLHARNRHRSRRRLRRRLTRATSGAA